MGSLVARYLALLTALLVGGAISPIPEEAVLLGAGYAITRGELHAVPTVVVSILGVVGGDLAIVLFGAGAARGARFVGIRPSEAMQRRAERALDRFGLVAVILARLVPGLRGAIFFVAGLTDARRTYVVLVDVAAACVHVPALLAIGAFASR